MLWRARLEGAHKGCGQPKSQVPPRGQSTEERTLGSVEETSAGKDSIPTPPSVRHCYQTADSSAKTETIYATAQINSTATGPPEGWQYNSLAQTSRNTKTAGTASYEGDLVRFAASRVSTGCSENQKRSQFGGNLYRSKCACQLATANKAPMVGIYRFPAHLS
jgi:hypothetical protein